MNGIDALINKDKGIEPFRDVLAARTAHIERAIKKAEYFNCNMVWLLYDLCHLSNTKHF